MHLHASPRTLAFHLNLPACLDFLANLRIFFFFLHFFPSNKFRSINIVKTLTVWYEISVRKTRPTQLVTHTEPAGLCSEFSVFIAESWNNCYFPQDTNSAFTCFTPGVHAREAR